MAKFTEHHPLLDCTLPTKSRWRGYYELMRLHKPIMGNTLMFWPCAWGLTMAAYANDIGHNQLAMQLSMFAIGSTLIHSAACVLNDICDIDFDRKVERCKTRPLAANVVTVTEAWILLSLLTIPAAAMLLLTNKIAALCGLVGLVPLHALYPLMKRWTYWPQAWLGLAMNWGYPVAWLSIAPDTYDLRVVSAFFLGTVCWTIVYDTIYACQDVADDAHAGVKSTALLFGEHVRPILALFAAAFVALLALAGALNGQCAGFFVVACGGAAGHFVWQFWTWAVDVPEDGGAKFQSNGLTGALIYAGILIDYLTHVRAAST